MLQSSLGPAYTTPLRQAWLNMYSIVVSAMTRGWAKNGEHKSNWEGGRCEIHTGTPWRSQTNFLKILSMSEGLGYGTTIGKISSAELYFGSLNSPNFSSLVLLQTEIVDNEAYEVEVCLLRVQDIDSLWLKLQKQNLLCTYSND